MVTILIYALATALIWMLIVGQATPATALVGLAIGLGLALLFRPQLRLNPRRLPDQGLALALYVLALFRDILLSSVDMTRRVLSPNMRLKPGIITVSTGDKRRSPVVLALSSDYISLTPGELVVEVKDDHLMYVHCLDVEVSAATADQQQARRLQLLLRILGRDK